MLLVVPILIIMHDIVVADVRVFPFLQFLSSNCVTMHFFSVLLFFDSQLMFMFYSVTESKPFLTNLTPATDPPPPPPAERCLKDHERQISTWDAFYSLLNLQMLEPVSVVNDGFTKDRPYFLRPLRPTFGWHLLKTGPLLSLLCLVLLLLLSSPSFFPSAFGPLSCLLSRNVLNVGFFLEIGLFCCCTARPCFYAF